MPAAAVRTTMAPPLARKWPARPRCAGRGGGQPEHQAARQQLAEAVRAMLPCWSKAYELVAGTETDVLAYMGFRIILARAPRTAWVRIHSRNVLERVIREGRRRIHVVGAFLDDPSLTRLVEALRVEMSHEVEIERGYFPCLERARTGSLETVRHLAKPEQIPVAEPILLRPESIR